MRLTAYRLAYIDTVTPKRCFTTQTFTNFIICDGTKFSLRRIEREFGFLRISITLTAASRRVRGHYVRPYGRGGPSPRPLGGLNARECRPYAELLVCALLPWPMDWFVKKLQQRKAKA